MEYNDQNREISKNEIYNDGRQKKIDTYLNIWEPASTAIRVLERTSKFLAIERAYIQIIQYTITEQILSYDEINKYVEVYGKIFIFADEKIYIFWTPRGLRMRVIRIYIFLYTDYEFGVYLLAHEILGIVLVVILVSDHSFVPIHV